MTKDQIEEIKEKIPEEDLRQLNDWKMQAYEDMHNIRFQMREFRRKDSVRKTQELAKKNTYAIDDEGEKKYNKQQLAYDKRIELVFKIDSKIGELRRQREQDYYYAYHAITRKKVDDKLEKEINQEALKISDNE